MKCNLEHYFQQLRKIKGFEYFEHINQSTYPIHVCMLFSHVHFNGWITCTFYGWGPQIFQNTEAIWKNLDSEEWHKGSSNSEIWAQPGCCSTHDLKIPQVCHLTQSGRWLSSLVTLEMQSSHALWRLCTLKSKTVITERIKHDVLNVSKSVAW